MLNMRPVEGPGPGSGPVGLRVGAVGESAGVPFRIPAPKNPASPATSDPTANPFRPEAGPGNVLPPLGTTGAALSGIRTLSPLDGRQMLEPIAARPGGEGAGVLANPGIGPGTTPLEGATPAEVAAMAGGGRAGMTADLLPDLELTFPAAPLEPRPGNLELLPPPLDDPAALLAASERPGGAPGSPGSRSSADAPLVLSAPPAALSAMSDALPATASALPGPISGPTGGPAAGQVPGQLPGQPAGAAVGSLPDVLQALRGSSGSPLPEATGERGDNPRPTPDVLSAGLTTRNSQPQTPALAGANGLAQNAPGMGMQPTPAGAEALAGLRQAMADLARDGGNSERRAAPEALSRSEGSGFLSTLGLTTASQAPTADRPSFLLPSPPGTPQFAEQVAERVVWMAGQKLDRAQIRLNPAHLGPISVDVSVGEDGANITFTAQHAVTRDALEQALPRLREMFSGSGLALAGADVSGHGADAHPGGNGGSAAADGEAPLTPGTNAAADAEAVGETPLRSDRGGRGLIDTYV